METHETTKAEADPVIIVTGLCKAFGDHIVLDGFNLALRRGESKVVLGRSGSGKSILIKCIIGLIKPDAGSIVVLGQDIQQLNHEEIDELRARVGFLFQSNALYDSKTVRENLEFPMRRHSIRLSAEEAESRVMEALENVGLAHTIDMMPAELSGGMQKRIALARALILKPDIILYDEPTTGLDPVTAREIMHLIRQIQQKYKTSSIIISHDMACVRETADNLAVLINGKCYAEGPVQKLEQSKNPAIKQFFEGAYETAATL
jgi:phospholipid/cholesterol/gamma-HCH transport system ATP-binding protein